MTKVTTALLDFRFAKFTTHHCINANVHFHKRIDHQCNIEGASVEIQCVRGLGHDAHGKDENALERSVLWKPEAVVEIHEFPFYCALEPSVFAIGPGDIVEFLNVFFRGKDIGGDFDADCFAKQFSFLKHLLQRVCHCVSCLVESCSSVFYGLFKQS